MLAAMWAVKTFRPCVLGFNFTVVTDHSPLQWLMNKPDLTGKHARWALSLQKFTFVITHWPGITHQNADVPSRYPQSSKIDTTGARLDEDQIAQVAALAISSIWTSSRKQWPCSTQWTCAMAAFNQSDSNLDEEENPTGLSDADAERHAKCVRVVTHAYIRVKQVLSSTPELLNKTEFKKHSDRNKVHCESLCMNPISSSFFVNAQKGLVLYEPFGGMYAGLEMVHRYYYSDIDPVARKLAATRMIALHKKVPIITP
jgi:hypothetical protein